MIARRHICKYYNRTEQNRTEQNRTEQNRTEQNRTEQNRTEQNRTEQNRTSRDCDRVVARKPCFPFLITILLGWLVVVLTACPTPEDPKGKGGGDDPTPEPKPTPFASFPFISPHSIVADITVDVDIDGEATLVITSSADKPTPPTTESIIDGFIERKLVKGITRHVYMGQNSASFNPATDSIGTLNDVSSLHAAFLKENTDYFLHLLYTKQGEGEVTHKSFAFTTMAYSEIDSHEYDPMDSFRATHNPAIHKDNAFTEVENGTAIVKPDVEWRSDKENFIMGWAIAHHINTVAYTADDTTIMGSCNPASHPFPASCIQEGNTSVVLFSNVSSRVATTSDTVAKVTGDRVSNSVMLFISPANHPNFSKNTKTYLPNDVLVTITTHEGATYDDDGTTVIADPRTETRYIKEIIE